MKSDDKLGCKQLCKDAGVVLLLRSAKGATDQQTEEKNDVTEVEEAGGAQLCEGTESGYWEQDEEAMGRVFEHGAAPSPQAV